MRSSAGQKEAGIQEHGVSRSIVSRLSLLPLFPLLFACLRRGTRDVRLTNAMSRIYESKGRGKKEPSCSIVRREISH